MPNLGHLLLEDFIALGVASVGLVGPLKDALTNFKSLVEIGLHEAPRELVSVLPFAELPLVAFLVFVNEKLASG